MQNFEKNQWELQFIKLARQQLYDDEFYKTIENSKTHHFIARIAISLGHEVTGNVP